MINEYTISISVNYLWIFMPSLIDTILEVPKNSEFFVSLGKQGEHSFLMLGVLTTDGPKLLARVGKTFDIDPDMNHNLVATKKFIGEGAMARLKDEGIVRKQDHTAKFTYQAYSINLEQVKEFLTLIAEIEEKQLSDPTIKLAIVNVGKHNEAYEQNKNKPKNEEMKPDQVSEQTALEKEAIRSYVPFEETDTHVTFKYQKVKDWNADQPEKTHSEDQELIARAQKLHARNTCRTTSLNIFERILGFATDISKQFFISPKYKATLAAGQPNANFYVLPAPPNTATKDLSPAERYTLEKLYKNLEKIPQSNPEAPATRAKFESLKELYKGLAGENRLSVGELLDKIEQHEQQNAEALHTKRNPNRFSELIGLKSNTEKMFNEVKAKLGKEKKKEQKQENSLEIEEPTSLKAN